MSRTLRKITGWEFDGKGKRDKKKWHKPNAVFKRFAKKRRKAKEKVHFLKFGEAVSFPKTNQWDWL